MLLTSQILDNFNGLTLSNPMDIDFDDKEIFISDTGNNRIVVLDKYSFGFLRSIKNSSMRKPYRTLPSISGDIYVKCFNSSNSAIIYRFSRIGELLSSYPSYTPYSLNNGIPEVESWYCSYMSFASRKAVFTFKDSEHIIFIDETDGSYWDSSYGYTLYGCVIDGSTGEIFVSAKNISDQPVVIELDALSGLFVGERNAPTYGFIRLLDQNGLQFKGTLRLSDPIYSIENNMIMSFNAVNDNSIPDAISFISPSGLTETEKSYVVPSDVKHIYDRNVPVDVWHFRHTGLSGTRASIDPNFTFSTLNDGSLVKSPVFCWSYEENKYVDTFFLSDGNYLKKIALWRDEKTNILKLEQVKKIKENNTIYSVYVFNGRVAVSAGGYLSIYSYDTMNRLSSLFISGDLVIYDYRFDRIWAGSKSSGTIWKIDLLDISNFETFYVKDAPVNLLWSDYFGKYVVQCENSLKFLNYQTGEVETFFDVNDYTIDDMVISGEKFALLLKSHEEIPVRSDFSTDAEFNEATSERKEDRIYVLVPLESEYIFEKSLPYNITVNSISFNGESISALMSDMSTVYVKVYDIYTLSEVSYSFATSYKPVGMVDLPALNQPIAVLTDGTVLDWSTGTPSAISWSATSSSSTIEMVSILSNGIFVKRSDVGKQTGSSSSSSSSSESSREVELYVRIVVGDTPGGANKWDSGEIRTVQKCMLYGGGNNLEPGQVYYASIRCKTESGNWTSFDTVAFVMPHFQNFDSIQPTSSSSSSNAVSFINTVYDLPVDSTIDCGSFEEIAVIFMGENGESAFIILGGSTLKIKNESGYLVFDSGGSHEHNFSFVGETFTFNIGTNYYSVTWFSDDPMIFTIYSG